MAGELVDGNGTTSAVVQGKSSIVGDLDGADGLLEGSFGVDREDSMLLSTSDRWSAGLAGGSQLILTVTGALRPSVNYPSLRIVSLQRLKTELTQCGIGGKNYPKQQASWPLSGKLPGQQE
jgi:hypothetical protein